MNDEVLDQGCGADDGDDGCDDLFIRRISRELQAPVSLSAGFDAGVMAAIRASGPVEAPQATPIVARGGAAGRAWRWVARPRTVRVSPLAGLAVAAGIAGVLLTARRADDLRPGVPATRLAAADSGARQAVDTGATLAAASGVRAVADTGAARHAMRVRPAVAGAEREVQMVAFVLVAPDAKQVAIVGDFNDWNAGAMPLKPVRRGGVWTITVPLKPGKYSYNFVVDGTRWMPDPAAPAAPADDFGTPASVVTVAGAQS